MTNNNLTIEQQLEAMKGQFRVMNYLVGALANYQGIEVQAIKKKLGNKATEEDLTRELLIEMERKAQAEFLKDLMNPKK